MNSQKAVQIASFDPNGSGVQGSLFGLPFTPETSELIIIPVPWEATVTYRTGTAKGPSAILEASRQIDFFMRDIPDAWKMGVSLLPIAADIHSENNRLHILVDNIRQLHDNGSDPEASRVLQDKVNEAHENLHVFTQQTAEYWMRQGKRVAILGGDHSTPLGLLRALSGKFDRFGILQIDAHADLRRNYEGFTYSHGSIMYNAMKLPAVSKLVQVGIRDFCEEEVVAMHRVPGRVQTFFDEDIHAQLNNRTGWKEITQQIIQHLPAQVYISFDIDGLSPDLCPHTGTPVPGGINFYQAVLLIKAVALSGRTIIGFDLCETAPGTDSWDAIVASRILWHLSHWMGVSNGWLQSTTVK
jgi:agmatinase